MKEVYKNNFEKEAENIKGNVPIESENAKVDLDEIVNNLENRKKQIQEMDEARIKELQIQLNGIERKNDSTEEITPQDLEGSKITRREFLAGAAGVVISPTLAKAANISEKVVEGLVENNFEKESEQEQREEISKQIRSELLVHVGSQEYLEKLAYGFEQDIEKAKVEQNRRIELLEEVSIYPYEIIGSKHCNELIAGGTSKYIDNRNEHVQEELEKIKSSFLTKIMGTSEEKIIVKMKQDWSSYYQKMFKETSGGFIGDRVIIPSDLPDDKFVEAITHELLHATTRGNDFILTNSRKKLDQSFVGLEGDLTQNEKEADEYLKMHTERLVRKQLLDVQLEKLGIKKYGEPFTMEHYNEMLKVARNDEIKYGALDFILTTFDPKKADADNFMTFKKIFDTIASTDTLDKKKNEFIS